MSDKQEMWSPCKRKLLGKAEMTARDKDKICRIQEGFCAGCGRSVAEIASWSQMTPEERQRVGLRLGVIG